MEWKWNVYCMLYIDIKNVVKSFRYIGVSFLWYRYPNFSLISLLDYAIETDIGNEYKGEGDIDNSEPEDDEVAVEDVLQL